MRTTLEFGNSIIGKTVEFTTRELEQMAKVCNKVTSIIENHKSKDSEKKEYLSDDDLYRIEAILMCILEKECKVFGATDFERYEADMRKSRESD